jgi:phenylacetate-CoA ligase
MSKNLLAKSNPDLLELISQRKALLMFKKAASKVPAYQKFLKVNKIDHSMVKSFNYFIESVPLTTKGNYVKKYSFENRSINGVLPSVGLIEESSGSSGHPTNWIKNLSEDHLLELQVGFESRYLLDMSKKKYVILSCWSPGPWTTDLKFCQLFEHFGLVKNIGPNIDGVIETMKKLGKKYNYLLAGYPPFCKELFEKGRSKINWKLYKIDVLVGGEGFALEWRKYVRNIVGKNVRIFSAYGASDVDIAIAFETPFSIFLRELSSKNSGLRSVFCNNGRYPMIFQYNPLAHYINNIKNANSDGRIVDEFSITPLDFNISCPKIKYNIGDEGKKIGFTEMRSLVDKHASKEFNNYLTKVRESLLHLPFLIIYGRSDGTISINGTNIYPEQVERALIRNNSLFSKFI